MIIKAVLVDLFSQVPALFINCEILFKAEYLMIECN